jgi:hypothetical protein
MRANYQAECTCGWGQSVDSRASGIWFANRHVMMNRGNHETRVIHSPFTWRALGYALELEALYQSYQRHVLINPPITREQWWANMECRYYSTWLHREVNGIDWWREFYARVPSTVVVE